MTTAMKHFLRSLALLAVLACAGQNATAQRAVAQPAWNEMFLAQDNQRPGPRITVADATELVQRQTGGRVLVIEDEPSLQVQVRARLEAEGYVLDACADGNEGLYLAAEDPHPERLTVAPVWRQFDPANRGLSPA